MKRLATLLLVLTLLLAAVSASAGGPGVKPMGYDPCYSAGCG